MDIELHHKVKQWHQEYLAWCVKNGMQLTEDYQVTKYALECLDFREKYEPFVKRWYKEVPDEVRSK